MDRFGVFESQGVRLGSTALAVDLQAEWMRIANPRENSNSPITSETGSGIPKIAVLHSTREIANHPSLFVLDMSGTGRLLERNGERVWHVVDAKGQVLCLEVE